MDDGWATITAYSKSENGLKLKQDLTFFKDPGYKDTARMLCESALTQLFNEKDIKVNSYKFF